MFCSIFWLLVINHEYQRSNRNESHLRIEFLSGFCHLCQAAIAHKVHTIKVIYPRYHKNTLTLWHKRKVCHVCFALQDMNKTLSKIAENFSTALTSGRAIRPKNSKSTWFILVFIVLGIYNFGYNMASCTLHPFKHMCIVAVCHLPIKFKLIDQKMSRD